MYIQHVALFAFNVANAATQLKPHKILLIPIPFGICICFVVRESGIPSKNRGANGDIRNFVDEVVDFSFLSCWKSLMVCSFFHVNKKRRKQT